MNHLSFFLLYLLVAQSVLSYTIDEIMKDQEIFQSEVQEFVKYRGKLLGDIWTQSEGTSALKETDVCDQLFEKALKQLLLSGRHQNILLLTLRIFTLSVEECTIMSGTSWSNRMEVKDTIGTPRLWKSTA